MIRIYIYILLILVELIFINPITLGNNTSYITLSNQLVRKKQLEVVANNVANADTIGYEQDDILIRKVDIKQNSKRKNSFVWAETNYKNGDSGSLKITNNPLDVAINSYGYFKVITPLGPRYTLNGTMIINSQNILVNSAGHPYSSQDGGPIEIPVPFQNIQIVSDGTIFVDEEAIGIIGVYGFDSSQGDALIKESGTLYKAQTEGSLLEEYVIISGALRMSNVNPTLAMAKMIEMQRSVGITNNLMSDTAELERSIISKISK